MCGDGNTGCFRGICGDTRRELDPSDRLEPHCDLPSDMAARADTVVKKTLVLLPGLDGTEIFYRPLIESLPEWIEPLVVTYPAGSKNSYGELLELAATAVAKVPEFWIFGWSFAGPLALMLASREPTRT